MACIIVGMIHSYISLHRHTTHTQFLRGVKYIRKSKREKIKKDCMLRKEGVKDISEQL